jgi:hypothetical protein
MTTSKKPAALEIRAAACEFKAAGAELEFEGYGSVFGVVDSYRERVMPGAFADSLARSFAAGLMPAMLWQHRADMPCGVWLEMREDARGLFVRGRLASTQLGREAYELLKIGALSGLSIGFVVKSDHYNEADDVTELLAVDLWEVSPVTFPACPDARVESVKSEGLSVRALERILREAGLSRSDAKIAASRGLAAVRDASGEDLSREVAEKLCRMYQG